MSDLISGLKRDPPGIFLFLKTRCVLPGWVEENHAWTPTSSGIFSTKLAYDRYFTGAITFEPHRRLWKTWSPLRIKIFLWLAIGNRCWTADRLAKRGLPHPDQCLLCDQEAEDINHVILRCSFSREVWHRTLQRIGLERLAPGPQDDTYAEWWRRAQRRAGRQTRKGVNSLIQLVAWCLWKERNRCLFYAKTPCIGTVADVVLAEAQLLATTGAKGLRQIL